jgi:hypothetical protein
MDPFSVVLQALGAAIAALGSYSLALKSDPAARHVERGSSAQNDRYLRRDGQSPESSFSG